MQLNNLNLLKQLNVKEYKNLMLSNLEIGDVFKAQIIDISNNNSLTLRLPDRSVITASSLIEFNIDIGDFIDLEVHEKSENQTFVQIIHKSEKNINLPTIEAKLEKLDIPIDDKNISIGKQMHLNNISFTKENFGKILQTSNEISVDKAIFLSINNISQNKDNLKLINDLVDHNNKLGDNLDKLNNLLNNIKFNPLKKNINDDINILKKAINSVIFEETNKINEEKTSNTIDSSTNNNKVKTPYNISHNQEKSLFIRDIYDDTLSKSNTINKELSVKEHIQEKPTVNNNKDIQQIEIKDIIKNLFVNVSNEKNQVLSEELDIKSIYNKIISLSKVLKSGIRDVGVENADEIITTLTNIERELGLISQITKFNSYFQIPVNINGYDTTAELFVFKDKKSAKNIDPNDSSLFISLGTKNLGTVESYIKVKNKNIECTFRNKNKRVLDIIKSKGIKLYKLMEIYGYKLTRIDYKILTQDDKCNIINCNDVKNKLDRKYSIDFKV